MYFPNTQILKPPPGTPLRKDHRLAQDLVFSPLFNDPPAPLGQTQDSSLYGNHGTLSSNIDSVPGKFGPALDFTAFGNNIDLGSPDILDQLGNTGSSMSIVAWVNLDSYNGNGRFIASNAASNTANGWTFQINGSPGMLWLSFGTGSLFAHGITTANPPINEWMQLAGTYDGNQVTLYINGVQQALGTDVTGSGTFTSGENVRIGSPGDTTNFREWNGLMDSVLLYARALSASEIAGLFVKPFQMFHSQQEVLFGAFSGAPPAGDIVVLRRRMEAA